MSEAKAETLPIRHLRNLLSAAAILPACSPLLPAAEGLGVKKS
jgi:hypothetical protein